MNKNRTGLLLITALLLAGSPAGARSPGKMPAEPGPLDPADLKLASVHAAVTELDTGARLYEKNADRPVPIASLTKLMMAMVVLDSGQPLDRWLTVVERREPPPNNAWSRIRIGSQLPRRDLLRIALMASENRAAYTLARHHPGGLEAFVAAMNARAARLGMTDTRFMDPSGLSPKNVSTAADLLKMVRAAHGYEKIREYTDTRAYRVRFRWPRYELTYVNTNVLVHRGHWDVRISKTGYLDEAGRCLAMVTDIDGRRVAMVLLDSFGKRTPVGDAGARQALVDDRRGRSGGAGRAAL